ncbi:MAG: tocopherol cyclase family protein [Candidatus Izemoplasmatales bacterium]|nr:tocopherol cyclase family protein [Candidatus Izemoplasmatales bacterium]
MSMLSLIRHPERYQGRKKQNRYFEGWYFKLVNREGNLTLSFIPGISKNKKDSHAFMQVILRDERGIGTLETKYLRFEVDDFNVTDDPFEIQLAAHRFSFSGLKLQSDEIQGTIQFSTITPIHTSTISPNIMGPYAYLQFMECYHGVLSMSHTLEGSLIYQGEVLNFSGGKGYIEKDWGRGFPISYVWLQSNHFDQEDVSFLLSVAKIPFGFMHYDGMIVNLQIGKEEYRFATYNAARILKKEVREGYVSYTIQKRKLRLEVEAKTAKAIELVAPKSGVMDHAIKEGLSGEIHLQLWKKNQLLYQGKGIAAGIEIVQALESIQ